MVEPYMQEHATIYGHNVWHYLISSTIGDFHIVEVEGKDLELQRKIIENNNRKAELQFKRFCKELLDGKYL